MESATLSNAEVHASEKRVLMDPKDDASALRSMLRAGEEMPALCIRGRKASSWAKSLSVLETLLEEVLMSWACRSRPLRSSSLRNTGV